MTHLAFRVYGLPVTQGSMRGFATPSGRVVVTHDKAKLRPWRALVADAAIQAGATVRDEPLAISVTFFLPRPKSAPKRITQPAKKPDLDKLIRGVMDALKGIAWNDDAQVVAVNAWKTFATAAQPVGAVVEVYE